MSEEKTMRLKQVATTLNISTSTVVDFLSGKGFDIENKPTSKITSEQFSMLMKAFESSVQAKIEAAELNIGKKHPAPEPEPIKAREPEIHKPEPVAPAPKPEPTLAQQPAAVKEDTTGTRLPGFKVVGRIELDAKGRPIPKPATPPVQTPAPAPVPAAVAAPPVVSKPEPVEAPVADKPIERAPEPAPAVAAPEPAPVPLVQETTAPIIAVPEPAPVAETKPEVPEPTPVEVPKPVPAPEPVAEKPVVEETPEPQPKVETPIDTPKPSPAPAAPQEPTEEEVETIVAQADKLKGLTVLGKIELPTAGGPKTASGPKKGFKNDSAADRNRGNNPPQQNRDGNANRDNANRDSANKKKRKRIIVQNAAPDTNDRPVVVRGDRKDFSQNTPGNRPNFNKGQGGNRPNVAAGAPKADVTDKQIQEQIKATLARLSGGKGNQANRAKYRREKRSAIADADEQRRALEQSESKTLKLTEFISANDLAALMNVSVNDVIKVCLGLGMFVSINQRLDAEAITIIADEFSYDVEFLSAEDEDIEVEEEDSDEDLIERAPIVTIMGHVDHGKTSLLDFIRNSKVTAGEAGGITQHIGAYDVLTETGKRITFLDTPGHEAFTAMRARGAKITDVVIIVVAADDDVMPQTKEALNHAQAAGVPIVIAINKVDKPSANPDRIREQLAAINILVEEWGGKYQCQEISAKTGVGIPDLLEKVLLESELLELKANPDRRATGSVIEASLDKGRGYVATIMVQTGTLHIGDIMLAGSHYGRVKAMTDHRGKKMKTAGPSTPVQVLGLDGAPQAGDKFVVYETEREAREIASSRSQLQREQSMRTKKHITLDEIGRRLAIGSFKELNVIVKGDVDGSVEALSDSLLKLSTNEVQVNILSKGVGQISESDVLLASASDAIIIGFQVRPSGNARRLAEQEQIDIRLYSIIYNAINEVKDAMEGMLAPTLQEVIIANVEVREVFRITKVGTIAGCMVTDGTIARNSKIRVVRDGIVVHSGDILALKRFKDDVSEVRTGYECGISIKNFNDLEIGDIIEAYEEKEVKRTL
ncbi:translation initiation factor IF-2 [Adhaeribacter rhizoryzae]|uniref:Translation initiation factor IF-2 n=1 Tax=Adhaeribacter rhizoryzae TaxID=2607907 RepID=A0A5M6DM96_9BACT|nr:translation initiation factor IF-2 [Adhaeribacter rhizoryzae]KAA5547546.1 translation initiation factor IF-2 [Adhaeribacter rhizoryzae]